MMIGSSKNDRENYPRKCFRTQEKETQVKFNPGLSTNRPSNNLAQAEIWPIKHHIQKHQFSLINKSCSYVIRERVSELESNVTMVAAR